MKKVLVIAGVAVGSVVALFVAAFIVLSILFPPERIKALVVPPAEQALGRTVALEGTGISVFPALGVQLEGVSIGNTGREGFAERPFVMLDRFVVRMKLLPLLGGKAVIRSIVLDRPDILVEVGPDGSYNFDDLAVLQGGKAAKGKQGRGGPMLPVPLTLESFRIRGGSVMYRDMKDGRVIGVGHIDQRIDLDIDKSLSNVVTTGELTLGDISLRTGEVPEEIKGVTVGLTHDLRLNLTEGTAAVNALRFSVQDIALELTGSIDDLADKPRVDLALRSDTIAVQDIIAEVPRALVPTIGKVRGEGTLAVHMDVRGRITDGRKPAVNGGLALRNVSIRHADFPQSVNDLNAAVSFSEDELSVEKLQLKVGENPIVLRALVKDFGEPRVDMVLKASLDLDDIKDVAALPRGVTVGGRVDADIQAKGEVDPSDPTQLRLDGSVKLDKVRVTTPTLVHPVVTEGTVTLSTKEIGNELAVTIGSSSMRIDADVRDFLGLVLPDSTKKYPRTNVRFKLSSPSINLDDMLVATEAQSTGPDEPRAPSEPVLLLASPLPRVDVRGNIDCAKLVSNGITLTDMSARVTHENDVADVRYDARLYGGTIDVDIHADVRDNTDIRFKAAFDADGVDLNRFVSTYNDRLPPSTPLCRLLRKTDDVLFGTLDLESEFSGRGGTTDEIMRTLRGSVYASAEDGRIASCGLVRRTAKAVEKFHRIDDVRFRTMWTRLQVRDQYVYVDELELQSDEIGDVQATGKLGFDASYDVHLMDRLPKSVSDKVVAAEEKIRGAGKSLVQHIGNDKLAAAAGTLLDRELVPTDRQGRVTLRLTIRGGGNEPLVAFQGFGGRSGGADRNRQSPRQAVEDKVKDDAAKAVGKEAGTVEEKTGEEVRKQAADLGKKAKKALRGLF